MIPLCLELVKAGLTGAEVLGLNKAGLKRIGIRSTNTGTEVHGYISGRWIFWKILQNAWVYIRSELMYFDDFGKEFS